MSSPKQLFACRPALVVALAPHSPAPLSRSLHPPSDTPSAPPSGRPVPRRWCSTGAPSVARGANIPDIPTRAYRDASDQVHVTISHSISHQLVGPTLGSVKFDYDVTLNSSGNADPSAYDDRQWVDSPYTFDGQTVYALLHHEYQGRQHPGQCTMPAGSPSCRVHSVTLATSTDAGATYTHADSSCPPRDERSLPICPRRGIPLTDTTPATSFMAGTASTTRWSRPSPTRHRSRASALLGPRDRQPHLLARLGRERLSRRVHRSLHEHRAARARHRLRAGSPTARSRRSRPASPTTRSSAPTCSSARRTRGTPSPAATSSASITRPPQTSFTGHDGLC